MQACLHKDTPRPQDSWHEQYSSTTSMQSANSPEKSLDLDASGASAVTATPLHRAPSPLSAPAAVSSDAHKAKVRRWIHAIAECQRVYCSGRYLPGIEASLLNAGAHLRMQ